MKLKSARLTPAVLSMVAALIFSVGSQSHADGTRFSATVDRESVSLDETVSLKLSMESDGNSRAGNPEYDAPDFEEVSEYTGTSINSYYDNGRFGMKTTQTLTRILKPIKKGRLKISRIRIDSDGKTLTAPDIVLEVTASGAGTPPQPNVQGGGGSGLRGTRMGNNPIVMVRAELNKPRVYKGEQLIVSYYLYSRVRLSNVQADKIPVLSGFLREDIDVAVLNRNQLDTDIEVVNGTQYRRSLLARYAAYPLQEGKLKIDTLGLKFTYFPSQGGGTYDEEDPVLNFFQNLTPRPGSERSQELTVEVMPVPEDGKPASFTGGVGDFNVAAAVNKTEVRANEAVSLIFKVEGRGNLAAIGEPKVKWPLNLELYESKGRVSNGKGGVGDKIFEFLLIPRVPGPLTLPAIEMSFFDPAQGHYVTRSTQPIALNVLEGAPGSAPPPSQSSSESTPGTAVQRNSPANKAALIEPRPLRPPGAAAELEINGSPVWRWLYWLFIGLAGSFCILVLKDRLRDWLGRNRVRASERALHESRGVKAIRAKAQALKRDESSAAEVIEFYDHLTDALLDKLEARYAVGARSLSRSELEGLLVGERGMKLETWKRVAAILEYAEAVKFASHVEAVSEQPARAKASHWAEEAAAFLSEN